MSRPMNILQLLLLVFVLGGLSACSDNIDEYIAKNPESNQCIPLTRTIEIPPLYCPRCMVVRGANPGDPSTVNCIARTSSETITNYEYLLRENRVQATGNAQRERLLNYGPQCRSAYGNSAYNIFVVPDLNADNERVGPVTWVVREMTGFLRQAARQLYEAIGSGLQRVALLLTTLLIMFYGISILMRQRQLHGYDVLLMFVRITLIYMLAFNWNTFSQLLVDVIEGPAGSTNAGFVNQVTGAILNQVPTIGASGLPQLSDPGLPQTGGSNVVPNSNVTTGVIASLNGIYGRFDAVVSAFFSWNFFMLLGALLFSSGMAGVVGFMLMLIVVISYLIALVVFVQAVVMAMIARFLLYAVAPISLLFGLINQTQQLMRNWFELLMSFTLQPIILIALLGVFHPMLETLLENGVVGPGAVEGSNTRFAVCYSEVNIVPFIPLYWFTFANQFMESIGSGALSGGMPVSLFAISAIVTICFLIVELSTWSLDVARSLTGGFVSVSGATIAGYGDVVRFAGRTAGKAGATLRGATLGAKNNSGNKVGGVPGMAKDAWRGATGSKGTSFGSRVRGMLGSVTNIGTGAKAGYRRGARQYRKGPGSGEF